MIQQIKNLRIQCDGLAQLTKELKPLNDVSFSTKKFLLSISIEHFLSNPLSDEKINSKEIDKAVDSLYLAKAWLGKVLGEIGESNPYGSGYKTVQDIVPTQDVSGPVIVFQDFNHIEKVDWLRTEIETVILLVKEIPTKDLSREFAIARTNSYNHLCEARFWLGFELERIKNANI